METFGEMIWHVACHAVEDTLPIIPFLLITYVVLELLEHMAGDRVNAMVRRAGAAGPVVGALAGIVPQCGFSAMGATLYGGRVITLGTLLAVFLSTSDEMLPLLMAERTDAALLLQIIAVKALIAAVVGLGADALLRALRGNARAHALVRRSVLGSARETARSGERDASAHIGAAGHGCACAREKGEREGAPGEVRDLIDELAEAGEGADHIHRLCERDHCGCDDGHEHGACGEHGAAGHAEAEQVAAGHATAVEGSATSCGHGHHHDHVHDGAARRGLAGSIARSAFSHTIQVTLFIFAVTLVLTAMLELIGEGTLSAILGANETLAIFASALVGLIPNCAASVVITQLYLEGVLSFAAMISGTLVGAGAGFLVLFRTNHSVRENVVILVALYVVAVACGVVLALCGAM